MLLAFYIIDNRNTELEDSNEGEKFVYRHSFTQKFGYLVTYFHLPYIQNVFGVGPLAANRG